MIPLRLKLYALAALLLLGGVSVWVRSLKATAYAKGYAKGAAHVADSVWVVDSATMQTLRDSIGRVSDSVTLRARTLEAAVLAKPLPASTPRIVLPPDVPTVGDSLISVWVESEERAFQIPIQAARAWAAEDSVLTQVAIPLLEQQRAVIHVLDSALTAEKDARAGSDSLTALYAARVRELTARYEPPGPERSRWKVAAKVVGVAALVVGVVESPRAVNWVVQRLVGRH